MPLAVNEPGAFYISPRWRAVLGGSPKGAVYISVEIALDTNRPAMKLLRYQVDRASEQRPMKWGLAPNTWD